MPLKTDQFVHEACSVLFFSSMKEANKIGVSQETFNFYFLNNSTPLNFTSTRTIKYTKKGDLKPHLESLEIDNF